MCYDTIAILNIFILQLNLLKAQLIASHSSQSHHLQEIYYLLDIQQGAGQLGCHSSVVLL
jgi:hypothetical protein